MSTKENITSKNDNIQELPESLKDCNLATIEKYLSNLNPAEIAHILDAQPAADRSRLFEGIPEGLDVKSCCI